MSAAPGRGDATVRFRFDGRELDGRAGDSILAALLARGVWQFGRQAGEARGPFCMMGLCQDCLVDIDGRAAEACRTALSPGMEVRAWARGERDDA